MKTRLISSSSANTCNISQWLSAPHGAGMWGNVVRQACQGSRRSYIKPDLCPSGRCNAEFKLTSTSAKVYIDCQVRLLSCAGGYRMVQGFLPCTASHSVLHSHDRSTRACVVPVEDLLDIPFRRFDNLGRILQANGPGIVSWRHMIP